MPRAPQALVRATLALAAALVVTPTGAMFRFDCFDNLVVDRVDPIVNYNRPGTHLHVVSGGNGFSWSADHEALENSSCTSCPIGADLSAYWTPALYVRLKNGTGYARVRSHQIVYYQPRGAKGEKIAAVPRGLKMLAGDVRLRTQKDTIEQRAITWQCINYKQPIPESRAIPNVRCPEGLRGQVNFPMCWNGRDLDSPDHKSHMAYAEGLDGGKCPEGYTKVIKIFYEMFYEVKEWDSEWAREDQHPFVLSNGDPTGYSFHGDFLNGWDVDVLQRATDECADKNYFNPAECPPLAPTYSAKPPATRCTKPPQVQEPIQVVKTLPGLDDDGGGSAGQDNSTSSPSPSPSPSSSSSPTPSSPPPSSSSSPTPTTKPSTQRPTETPVAPDAESCGAALEKGTDYTGRDAGSAPAPSAADCCGICRRFAEAVAFSYLPGMCYCKRAVGAKVPKGHVISGVMGPRTTTRGFGDGGDVASVVGTVRAH